MISWPRFSEFHFLKFRCNIKYQTKKILFILIILTSYHKIQASTFDKGSIKGSLLDERSVPVPYATILLKRTTDSSLYKGVLSNDKGTFTFDMIQEGNYFLEIKAIGFEAITKPNINLNEGNSKINLGVIHLVQPAKQLGEITVKADKPFIEKQAGQTVVNIENSIVQSGSSALEMMEKLPGVQVNSNGQVSLQGKPGVVIAIDGRPTLISGQELSMLLSSVSSSEIQKVEIITNPSAKYDAAGDAGIINIIMKKSKKEGLNGSINLGYSFWRYQKYNSILNLNFKKDWYNFYLSYGFFHREVFNDTRQNMLFRSDTANGEWDLNYRTLKTFNTHSPRLGADFTLSKTTTISLLATGRAISLNTDINGHTNFFNNYLNKTSGMDFINVANEHWFNYGINAELRHLFDTLPNGKQLLVNLDYTNYWNTADQNIETTLKDTKDNLIGYSSTIGNQKGKSNLYAIKMDYSQPLGAVRLETGVKSNYIYADRNNVFFNVLPNDVIFDYDRSNQSIYTENINAAYINVNKGYKKLKATLGLRAEHTSISNEQLLTNQKFTKNYLQLFPSLFLNYKFNEKHLISLDLGKRINRPTYSQINPLIRYNDPMTYFQGNPYLQPQLTYKVEMTYSLKNTFFATLGYNLNQNNITLVAIRDEKKNNTLITSVNLYRLYYYNLDLVYSKKVKSWWNTYTDLLFYYGIYDGIVNQEIINKGTPSFQFNTRNNFYLTDELSMECSFVYNYKNQDVLNVYNTKYNLSLGIQKMLFKKRGSISVNVNDILWSNIDSGVSSYGNVQDTWRIKSNTRMINVNFTYRFGKNQVGRSKNNTGADEDKKRFNEL